MDYKVLYRKYRPNDFENIVDQSYTIDILKNAITMNKISHAYIFAGPRGTGKTTTAKVFAKSINCENFSENGPCGTCNNCENFSSSPDIIEIDAASNNGVDEIRELINSVKLAPTNSRYKVYIIDEVHMLTQSAFNALLLTLEEPPKHVVFILATTNIESVPVTILSRCQRFDFKKISDNKIINRLKFVCDNENIIIEDDALEEIAYLADGGMRDALSILDQLSSVNEKITIDDVTRHFGSVSIKKIFEIVKALDKSDNNTIISIMDNFRRSSVEYKTLIKKLLDVLYKKAILIKESNKIQQGLSYDKIKSLTFDLVDCINKVNVAIDPFMLIEIILLNYTNNENIQLEKSEQIKREEHEEKTKKIVVDNFVDNSQNDKGAVINNIKKIRINNCYVNAKKDFLQEIKNSWKEFLDALNQDKKLYGLMVDSIPVAASDTHFIITTGLSDTTELINSNVKDIEYVFSKIFNKNYKIVAISEIEWDIEKREYINNIKNGVIYTYIEEIIEKEEICEENIEKLAKDIFEQNKIEIN